jgi:hypothetical protein
LILLDTKILFIDFSLNSRGYELLRAVPKCPGQELSIDI